jgi:hypothetical protein
VVPKKKSYPQFIKYLQLFPSKSGKLFWAVLGSYPANLATYLIKKHQQIDVYDKETDYNPFYFSKHSSS